MNFRSTHAEKIPIAAPRTNHGTSLLQVSLVASAALPALGPNPAKKGGSAM